MNNKGDAHNMIKNNDKSIVLGIDIGGTTCKCGVFTTDGELLYKDEIATRKDEGGSLILSDMDIEPYEIKEQNIKVPYIIRY